MLDGFKRESREAGPSSGLWPEARAVSQLGSSVIFAQETGGMKQTLGSWCARNNRPTAGVLVVQQPQCDLGGKFSVNLAAGLISLLVYQSEFQQDEFSFLKSHEDGCLFLLVLFQCPGYFLTQGGSKIHPCPMSTDRVTIFIADILNFVLAASLHTASSFPLEMQVPVNACTKFMALFRSGGHYNVPTECQEGRLSQGLVSFL